MSHATANVRYPIHSDSINTQINATIDLLKALGDLIQQESQALRASDSDTVISLQEKKLELGHLYHDAMHALGEKQEELKEVSPAKKELLKSAYKIIHAIFDENVKALEAARYSAQRLSKLIIDTARKAASMEGPNYNESGNTGPSENQSVYFNMNEQV